MTEQSITTDYAKYSSVFEQVQNEGKTIIRRICDLIKDRIDIYKIHPRNEIKALDSILKNFREGKYSDIKSIIELEDIAGLRITCYVDSEIDICLQLIEAELKKEKVEFRVKPEKDTNETPYRARHLIMKIKSGQVAYNCEVQIRTITADSWAVLDHKYVYKKFKEGEPKELTKGVSDILRGCEKIWDVIKKKHDQKITNKQVQQDVESVIERIAVESPVKIIKVVDQPIAYQEWLDFYFKKAKSQFDKTKYKTHMLVTAHIIGQNYNFKNKELLASAKKSTISTFGWSIGVFLETLEYKPKISERDSVSAEINVSHDERHSSYDFWSISKSGNFFLLKSIFEDERDPQKIFFNTRIIRITETLKYLSNLYNNLGVSKTEEIEIRIDHAGMKDRILGAAGHDREMFFGRKASLDSVSTKIITNVQSLEGDLFRAVKQFTDELFEAFDGFELSDDVLRDIINKFNDGKCT